MPTPVRPLIRRGALVAAGASLLGAWTLSGRWEQRVDAEAMALESVAAEAAAGVDAVAHARIRDPADASSAAFRSIQGHLRTIEADRDIGTPIYTVRRTEAPGGRPDESAAMSSVVVMTTAEPRVGSARPLRPEMRRLLDGGGEGRGRTGVYRDRTGAWISGFAVLVGDAGEVEGLVCVDRASMDMVAARRREWLLLGLGVIWLGLASALPWGRWARGRRVLRGVRRSLAMRIGLAGALAVLVAAVVTVGFEYRAAREDLVRHLGDELRTVVAVAAPTLDPALHAEVALSGHADSEAFLALQRRLRQIKESARLRSPIYTLRRDQGLARFVVMTNEVPFVGDPNELRPGVNQTFEDGEARAEGPYSDAHGTWISAWAPVRGRNGQIVAVLQADHEVGALIVALQNRMLQRVLFSLLGVVAAFVAAWGMARGIARPVSEVAAAARAVGAGLLVVELPEDREDEVGDLARELNRMVKGLREREHLKTMFGKYMAVQVAQELMDRGDLRLEGELRELSVLITDIRGYTALTEELGAAEVVALLNEYFAILVDVVIAHDGVIDKFMGDAMLCWFGAPLPLEDHAARAVAAAVAIQERTAQWNAQRVREGRPPVATGIGIATGPVVLGNIGSPQRLEYTAIGDAVNLASRLCGRAGSGELLVTGSVREAAAAHPFEGLGPLNVKGLTEPVPVHLLRRPVVAPDQPVGGVSAVG